MKRVARTFQVSEPFSRALDVMSREMGLDVDALVNQALFALARTHGFVVPTVVPLDVAPQPAATAATPVVAPAPEASAPELAPAPTSAAPVEPPPLDPAAERALVAGRLEELGRDVDALVVPVAPPPPEEDDETPEDDEDAREAPEEAAGAQADDAPEDTPATGRAEEPEEEATDPRSEKTGQAPALEVRAEATNVQPALEETTDARAKVVDEPPEDEPREHTVLVRPSKAVRVWVKSASSEELVVGGRFVIGRGPQCNLVIDSLRVSREHLAVEVVGKDVVIEDLGSSNGTWVNGQKVTRHMVTAGDEIFLGNEPIHFRVEV
jgi:hypothetical protein